MAWKQHSSQWRLLLPTWLKHECWVVALPKTKTKQASWPQGGSVWKVTWRSHLAKNIIAMEIVTKCISGYSRISKFKWHHINLAQRIDPWLGSESQRWLGSKNFQLFWHRLRWIDFIRRFLWCLKEKKRTGIIVF